MDPSQFRAEFPVTERKVYLNAGTDGPVPRRGAEVAQAKLAEELSEGRAGRPHFDAMLGALERRRELIAELHGCDTGEVALTHSTTDGVNIVIGGLDLRPGDEIVTSDEEHPGLLVPLAFARHRRGVILREAPFAEIANAVTDKTRLVATSHVSWVNGQIVDSAALQATGVPFLLDGAQGLGAVPTKVRELGCDFYAASGQKWLCGPDGSGSLYVRSDRLDELEPRRLGFGTIQDPHDPLGSPLQQNAKRLDLGFSPSSALAWAVAAFELFGEAGWDWVHERAATLATQLADTLAERGKEVQSRGRSTLVSWGEDDCEATAALLGENGVVVRFIPGRGLVRASVGAWNDESDVERLVSLVAA
ncbi:MAG TPA: aminotransferase class V-fold PLP-dependent enzyme [Thermoleophilaceae bacterium]